MSAPRSPLVTLGATAVLAVALFVVNELADDDSSGGYAVSEAGGPAAGDVR